MSDYKLIATSTKGVFNGVGSKNHILRKLKSIHYADFSIKQKTF